LILGRAVMFPKTYSRWNSVLRGGKDGMKIVVGLVPFFLVAAFFEGFVTRHYQEMPAMLKFAILLLSLVFIIWYFIIYPIRLHKRIESAKLDIDDSQNQNFQVWLNKKLNLEK
jgi:uncharacterized membrane protein SpoIIM required for sporulation